MHINTKKLTKGFTIIEVLIVLAIAGLILAIIFLAVPALQRNSRNQGIRSDAASLLAGVNEYVANNNGQLPSPQSTFPGSGTGTITIGVPPAATAEVKTRGGTIAGSVNTSVAETNLGEVTIHLGWKCNGSAPSTAATRSVAASFRVENTSGGGTGVTQCIDG